MSVAINHQSRGHAKWGMSGMYRWKNCHAYIGLSQNVPARPSGPAAIRGTLLHEWQNYWVMTEMLGVPASALMAPGEAIKPAEAAGIRSVMDYAQQIREEFPDAQLMTERYMPFPQRVVPFEDCGGTVDLALYSQAASRGWVIDSKFGSGHFVKVEGNPQGLGYGISAFWHVPVKEVTIVIGQPFLPDAEGRTIREWTVAGDYLMEFQDEVEQALLANLDPKAQPHVGPWCDFCPAFLACPAQRGKVQPMLDAIKPMQSIEDIKADITPYFETVPNDRLADLMANEEWVKKYFATAKSEATRRAAQGQHIPGYKLVETQAKAGFKVDKSDPGSVEALAHDLARTVVRSVYQDNPPPDIESTEYYKDLVSRFIVTTSPTMTMAETRIREEVATALPNVMKKERNTRVLDAVRGMKLLTEKKGTGKPVIVTVDSHRPAWNPSLNVVQNIVPMLESYDDNSASE